MATEKRQIRRFQRRDPTQDDVPVRNAFEYLQMIYIARNWSHWSVLLPLIVLCVYVYYFFAIRVSLKFEPSESKTAARKPSFTWHSHSTSFYRSFILQSVTGRQVVTYRHAGLISEVSEKVATQIAKNCSLRQPRFHLRPPPRGTAANVRMHFIFPETRVIGLHFCRW